MADTNSNDTPWMKATEKACQAALGVKENTKEVYGCIDEQIAALATPAQTQPAQAKTVQTRK